MLIETERLRLRPPTINDVDELVALHAEPEVMQFMGALDQANLIEWVQLTRRDWAERGHGRVAMIERATGRLLGRAGLKRWAQLGETELGWVLHPDAWGRGLTSEAGRASAQWGFQNLEVPYLTAMIHPENARSIAVAKRLGMTPLRSDAILGEAVTVYWVARGSWAMTDEPPRRS